MPRAPCFVLVDWSKAISTPRGASSHGLLLGVGLGGLSGIAITTRSGILGSDPRRALDPKVRLRARALERVRERAGEDGGDERHRRERDDREDRERNAAGRRLRRDVSVSDLPSPRRYMTQCASRAKEEERVDGDGALCEGGRTVLNARHPRSEERSCRERVYGDV